MTENKLQTIDENGIALYEPDEALPLDQQPAAIYLMGLSAGSRRTMREALDNITKKMSGDPEADKLSVDWSKLRFQHTSNIRAALAEEYAPATANKYLSAIRQTLKTAWELGQMSAEDYQRAVNIKNIIGETVPSGRHVTMAEISALLDSCGQSVTDIRDAAIIGVLYAGGLRRAELIGLDYADYKVLEDDVGQLLVKGKRRKERFVYLDNGAYYLLKDWLDIRGDEPGSLFWGVSNRQRRGRMTSQAIYNMLKIRAKDAGIADLSPHDFRRTFVGDLLEAGADIVTVQKMASHANPATTSRYDRRGERAKKKAAQLLHVPYKKRTLGE